MHLLLKQSVKQYVQALFPTLCLLCDFPSASKRAICNDCFETLPIYSNETPHTHSLLFDRFFALFDYAEPVSTWVSQLKFHGDLPIAHLFAHCWISTIDRFYTSTPLPELIIPVPLHPTRLKERGFNQALEIAKPIAKHFQIKIDTRSCIRIKNTQAQSTLPAKKRENNVKNAFGLSYSLTAKHVAIMDDVMTTGNTIAEISHLLKKNGVEKIDVWCCARAQ